MSEWLANVENLKDKIEERCVVINGSMEDCYEEIEGQHDLTVVVSPPGSGKVRVNSVTPQTYPYNATYFGGLTLELQATPEPGFLFTSYESTGGNTRHKLHPAVANGFISVWPSGTTSYPYKVSIYGTYTPSP